MGEERQSQTINGKMPFDDERFWGRESVPKLSPIGTFVVTKPNGFYTGIASVLDCL
jgi:hypothetical protein